MKVECAKHTLRKFEVQKEKSQLERERKHSNVGVV